MKRLRILITAPTFPPFADGVAHVAYEHARALASRGHEVSVATARAHCRRPPPQGIRVFEFEVSGNANVRSRYNGETSRYERFIRECSADVIACHCWQTWSTDLAVRGFRSNKAKKLLVSHGVSANTKVEWPRTIPNYVLWRPYVWFTMPHMIQEFDRLVLLSARTDSDRFYDHALARSLGVQAISIIPNGSSLDDPASRGDEFRTRHNVTTRHLVLSVGKFDRIKNELATLKAFMQAANPDCTLVLIGPRDNEYARTLKATWRAPTPSSRLIVLSGLSQEEIRNAYRAADLFVSSSRTEYFPLVVLDAMACGVPFVSTDVGCVGDLPGGVVVRRHKEMVDVIRRLLGNDAEREALGRAGRRSVAERYSWAVIGPHVVKIFEELAGDD